MQNCQDCVHTLNCTKLLGCCFATNPIGPLAEQCLKKGRNCNWSHSLIESMELIKYKKDYTIQLHCSILQQYELNCDAQYFGFNMRGYESLFDVKNVISHVKLPAEVNSV